MLHHQAIRRTYIQDYPENALVNLLETRSSVPIGIWHSIVLYNPLLVLCASTPPHYKPRTICLVAENNRRAHDLPSLWDSIPEIPECFITPLLHFPQLVICNSYEIIGSDAGMGFIRDTNVKTRHCALLHQR